MHGWWQDVAIRKPAPSSPPRDRDRRKVSGLLEPGGVFRAAVFVTALIVLVAVFAVAVLFVAWLLQGAPCRHPVTLRRRKRTHTAPAGRAGVDIRVQVRASTRARIRVSDDATEAQIEQAARAAAAEHINGRTVRRTIVLPGHIFGFVVD